MILKTGLLVSIPFPCILGLTQCSGGLDSVSQAPRGESTSRATASALSAPQSIAHSVILQGTDGNCIDVVGGDPSPGARVQSYTCNGTNAQKFNFNDDGTITNQFGNCLDVMFGDANAGNLQFFTCNGTPAQNWQQHGDRIIGLQGKCLNVSTSPIPFGGMAVNLTTCDGTDPQRWQLDGAPTILQSVGSECLDIINGSTSPGARLQIYECNRGLHSEMFTFTTAGEIKNTVGECLDVMNGDPSGGRVQMTNCNGTAAQHWRRDGRAIVAGLNDGLFSQCLSTVSTFATGSPAVEVAKDHTAVGIATCNGTKAQEWVASDLYQHGPATLVVVTSDVLASAFDSFLTHKRSIGVATKLLTISQIAQLYPASDDAASLKLAIRDYYENFGTEYILLGGDTSQVPIRYRRICDAHNCGGGGPTDGKTQSFVFSDLYYANLYSSHSRGMGSHGAFDTWDSNGNGFYDESDWDRPTLNPDNVDGFPDVAVGRIPAFNAAVLQSALTKIINYENLNPAFGGPGFGRTNQYGWAEDTCYGSAANAVTALSQQVGRTFAGYAEEVGMNCQNGDGKLGTAPGSPFVTDDTTDANGNHTSWTRFQSAMQNSGFEWLTYVGHGGPNVWGRLGTFSNNQISNLTNSNLPIVMAAACGTARFAAVPELMPLTFTIGVYDPNAFAFSSSSIGAQFLFQPGGGAIAYIGENVTMQDTLGVDLIGKMFQRHSDGYVRLGDMWRMAGQDYFDEMMPFNGTDPFAHPRHFLGLENLLGDPSMRTP